MGGELADGPVVGVEQPSVRTQRPTENPAALSELTPERVTFATYHGLSLLNKANVEQTSKVFPALVGSKR